MSAHTCHATGCPTPVPPVMFMCKRHWFIVPKPMRDEVWRTYRAGQCDDMRPSAAYCEAAKAAVVAVATKEQRVPDTRLYDLFLARSVKRDPSRRELTMVGNNGLGEPIDRKFVIMARCQEHGHVYDDNHSVLMLAKDKAVPATLRFYRAECERIGAAPAQLQGIDLLIERVDRYQQANPGVLKVADVDEEKGAHILAPNRPT